MNLGKAAHHRPDASFVTKAAERRHEDKLAAIAAERNKIVALVLPNRLLARMRICNFLIKSVAFCSFHVHILVNLETQTPSHEALNRL
jgi:hypothetical protein